MRFQLITAIAITSLMAGCASDTAGLTTSSLAPGAPQTTSSTAAKVDPTCVTLMSRIDAIRKEGVVDRVEKVATSGKSSTVSVKRSSIAKLTELDKANAEYQAKCSTITPGASSAQVKPATTGTVAAATPQPAPKTP
jgi:hypothetical protein